jgi:hypothetical protein
MYPSRSGQLGDAFLRIHVSVFARTRPPIRTWPDRGAAVDVSKNEEARRYFPAERPTLT